MKIPTIKDIAAEAGVTHCAVSHVLHNDAYAAKVRPETRQRILNAAAKLGYVQNQLAIATRTGQVNTIALIVNFTKLQDLAPVSQIISGVMMESSARYYSIKIFSEDELEQAFRQIAENRIGKVISLSVDHELREHAAELAEKYSMQLVFAYEHGHRKFPAVNVDNAEMAAKMVHYLFDRGHDKIGFLGMPHPWHWAKDRLTGYLHGMAECGLKVDPRWTASSEDIERSVDHMISLPDKVRPTAFAALTDSVAATALRHVRNLGLRLPDDFSVIGIGNTILSNYTQVRLTSMEESRPELGKLLVRLLLDGKLDIQPDQFNVYRIHADIIERESVFNRNNNKSKRRRSK